jgi:hypothetical protein
MTRLHTQSDATSHPTMMAAGLFVLLMTVLSGCTHMIDVHPLPTHPAHATIPRSLQVVLTGLTIQGADHMPGITLLEWRPRALTQALIHYIRERGTFPSVSADAGEITLAIATKLAMTSRTQYQYRITLQAEMRQTATGMTKTYLVDHSAPGSTIRWVTASDRDPIEAALQHALEDLLTQIEIDRPLYLSKEPQRGTKPEQTPLEK